MKFSESTSYLPIDRTQRASIPLHYHYLSSHSDLWMLFRASCHSHGLWLHPHRGVLLGTETVDTFQTEDACELAQLQHLIT